MKTSIAALSAIALVTLLSAPVRGEGEIGFLEKFALAPDRNAALAELVPGSEDYYYFHALQFQNARQKEKLKALLEAWRKHTPESPQREVIENREALLSYDTSPKQTLEFLTKKFELHFDDQRDTPDEKPDLPSVLDQSLISYEAFQSLALGSEDGLNLSTKEALEHLVRDQAELTGAQIRNVLSRLQRPDLPHLVDLIVTDLNSPDSAGFGGIPIHHALLPEQLDELVKRIPALAENDAYINTRIEKLAPGGDAGDFTHPEVAVPWMDRLWNYARSLPPSHNTTRARILNTRLQYDRSHGAYDRERFLEYLKIPRPGDYISRDRFLDAEKAGQLANLDSNEVAPSLVRLSTEPIHSDEALVRDYFLHFFTADAAAQPDLNPAALLKPWKPYVQEDWLKPVLAEAMITHGIGQPEQWASFMSASEFQALKSRVDVEFSPTNPERLKPEDEVSLDLFLKNTPKVIVKVYEINALSYYLSNGKELNTDLPLDGLVANRETTHDFSADKDGANPFHRALRTFKFPELKGRRGAWIIEFIGGGRSSRALIRKGQWSAIQNIGPAGDMITVLDEKRQPVKDAAIWVDGRKFTVDEKAGAILLPFTQTPSANAVLTDATGEFANLVTLERHAEDYTLDAQFHIAREQLIAGKQATLAMRTSLRIGNTQLPLDLLEDVTLEITTTTLDVVSTTSIVKIDKLDAAKDYLHTFLVPDRLQTVEAKLMARIPSISDGSKIDLEASDGNWSTNGIDTEEVVTEGLLSKIGNGWVLDVLGRNGEPIANEAVELQFDHRAFGTPVGVTLSTNAKGRIDLGPLNGIQKVRSPRFREWTLPDSNRTWQKSIHAKAGEAITIPWTGDAPPDRVSLLEECKSLEASFVADRISAVSSLPEGAWKPGMKKGDARKPVSAFVINGLPAGNYSLSLGGNEEPIEIRVTDGIRVGNWLLSPNRELEIRDPAPLNIQSVTRAAAGDIVIQLVNANPYTRVHVAASRFLPDVSLFHSLGNFERFEPGTATPASLPNLFAAGRDIGDEFRYILERRYAKLLPGNMLSRPGLILDPWELASTDVHGQHMAAGQKPASTPGARPAETNPGQPESKSMVATPDREAAWRTDLDFLAAAAPTLYNLVPDEHGVVRLPAKALGDRQYVQVYAEDLADAVSRTLALPEAPTQFRDLRLSRAIDPQKPFVQRQEQAVIAKGETLKLADIRHNPFKTYDSLASVYAVYISHYSDANLNAFAWIFDWPKFKPEEKQAKYSEFACHELNFFLWRKDPEFFARVIRPHLQNKKDKQFMDEFLLGNDLHRYLAPWAYDRLNIAERCLLSQRIPGEAAATARRLRELCEMQPLDLQHENWLFETALLGQPPAPKADEITPQIPQTYPDGAPAAPAAPADKAPENAATPQPTEMKLPPNSNVFHGGGTQTETSPNADSAGHVAGANQITGNNRSGGVAVSPNAINALLFGAPAAGSAAPNAAAAPATPSANIQAGAVIAGVITNPQTQTVLRSMSAGEAQRQRSEARQFFQPLGATKEWAEQNYYHVPLARQYGLIPVNAFWRDYAAWNGKTPFLSPHFVDACGSFTEIMLAMGALDLPFVSPEHESKSDGDSFEMTAGGPLLLFHRAIEPAAPAGNNPQFLVSERFYRSDVRPGDPGYQKIDQRAPDEFLPEAVYTAIVVITNPSPTDQEIDLLTQIPEGALPVKYGKFTTGQHFRIRENASEQFEYSFYFPTARAEPFAHYPASVSQSGVAAGAAKPMTFKVVKQLTADQHSWNYISQDGTEQEVFAFLEHENLERLDLSRVAWRARKSIDFFHKMIAVLEKQHLYRPEFYAYGIFHNDAPVVQEWLRHQDEFVAKCGPWLRSKLLTVDPVERGAYEHLEYAPLVNQRAHRIGGDHRIPNPVLRAQYRNLLDILAHKPQLDAMDQMSLTYYLFLQDRTEEALARFHAVAAAELPTRIQYDYLQCYADFYEERLADARGIANKYADYPIDRWKNLFAEVSSQLDEIEGKGPAAKPAGAGVAPDAEKVQQREAQQSDLASTEPSFDFKVENRQIALNYKNLREVSVRYYLMDPEFLFSASPFVAEDSNRASIVKPTKASVEKLPEGTDHLRIPLPAEFEKANVLVEILGAGLRKSQAYHANTLKLSIAENYGRLEVRDEAAGKPISKAYIKVYARLKGGTIRFFKDGYTDLRGKFDYASLNSSENPQASQLSRETATGAEGNYQMLQPQELNSVEKLSILIMSETHGAAVREVNAPSE